jgi:xylulokinase
VNGTGILNSWLRRNFLTNLSYEQMNQEAASVGIGAEGLQFFPFGNGAERILGNKNIAAHVRGLQFNTHSRAHVARAAQEGIAFALNYGMEIMHQMGMSVQLIRAAHTNMFLSKVFAQTLANVSNCVIELYHTDGATGAARAAGVGAGYYKSFAESFRGMESVRQVVPDNSAFGQTQNNYQCWKNELQSLIK